MKNILLLALTVISSSAALAAPKTQWVYASVALSAKGEVAYQNEMDDDLTLRAGFDFFGYGFSFITLKGETFKITAKLETNGNPEPMSCKILGVEKRGSTVRVRVQNTVETDSGANCTYSVTTNQGRKGAANFYSEGT